MNDMTIGAQLAESMRRLTALIGEEKEEAAARALAREHAALSRELERLIDADIDASTAAYAGATAALAELNRGLREAAARTGGLAGVVEAVAVAVDAVSEVVGGA